MISLLWKISQSTINRDITFIEANIPDFRSYIEKDKESTYAQVQQYLKRKQFSAKTFEEYGLRGTPSAILIDKNGVLRQTIFISYFSPFISISNQDSRLVFVLLGLFLLF